MKKSFLLEKVLRQRQFKWENGEIRLFNTPLFMGCAHREVSRDHLLNLNCGEKKSMSMIYQLGLINGKDAFAIYSKFYGKPKTVFEMSKTLDFQIKQSEVIGRGITRWAKKDFKNKIFVMHLDSTYAKLYKKKIGLSKKAVDHLVRGIVARYLELILDEPCLCIETRCIAKGDRYCEFTIKPLKKWDKKHKLVKEQIPLKIKKDKITD